MRRMLLIVGLGCLWCVSIRTLYAETVITSAAETDELVRQITGASAEIRTLQCDFKQVKTLTMLSSRIDSEGKLYYARENRLRWQYTTPYDYLFIMNGTQVLIESGTLHQTIDAGQSRLFRQLCAVISGGIDGSLLADRKSHQTTFTRGEDYVAATLHPQTKPFRDLFSSIRIELMSDSFTCRSIVLEETGGDRTEIRFTHCILNQPIDDELFDIH